MDFDCDRALKTDLVTVECGAEFAIQCGIVGLPDELADPDAAPVDVTVPEMERALVHGIAARGDLVDATAFFARVGFAGIEHDAVTGLEWCDQTQ